MRVRSMIGILVGGVVDTLGALGGKMRERRVERPSAGPLAPSAT